MEDRRIGRVVRAVRRRLELRQSDIAGRVGVSQSVISKLERGQLESVGLATLRRVAVELDISITINAGWRGGQGDRLLDRAHAAIVDHVVDTLVAQGWDVTPEFSFNHFGDRGSVDVLAWHPGQRILLIIEVKATLTDLQDLLASLSRKLRVVPDLARKELGWGRGPRREDRRGCRDGGEPFNRRAARRDLRGVVPGRITSGSIVAASAPRPAGGSLVRLYQFPGDWYVGRAGANPPRQPRSCVSVVRCSRWTHGTNTAAAATALVVAGGLIRTMTRPERFVDGARRSAGPAQVGSGGRAGSGVDSEGGGSSCRSASAGPNTRVEGRARVPGR